MNTATGGLFRTDTDSESHSSTKEFTADDVNLSDWHLLRVALNKIKVTDFEK